MSLRDCIDSAFGQGQITKEEADELTRRYDNLARTILDKTRIKGQLLAELAAEAQEKQRRALLTETARKRLIDDLAAYKAQHGEMATAFKFMFEHFGEARFNDVENHKKTIIGQAHAKMDAALDAFHRGWLIGHYRRQTGETKVRLDNVVRELFGEKTGDERAAGFAKVMAEVMEDLRVRFNEAGGSIAKLDKWGLPQSHDRVALMNVGHEAWINRLMKEGVLDRDRMINATTGRPMTDAELRGALFVAYERITTDGWIDREPSGVPTGKGAMWKQHQDHRFLHFKDAGQWLAYQRDFGGNADPFDTVMDHVYSMARDIAAMEMFGPNPAVLIQYLKQVIMKDAQVSGDPRRINQAKVQIHRAEQMWDYYRGTTLTPVNERLANVMSGTRSFMTAASMGSAMLSAISDVASTAVSRAFVGMGYARSSSLMVLKDVIAMNAENRSLAVRSGLILDEAMHGMRQQARYAGTINTRSKMGFLADRTIALSGLAAYTQRVKHAFGLEFQGFMADQAGTAWDQLPDKVRRTLDRHGFTAAEWDQIRAVKKYEPASGAFFLRPNEIAEGAGRPLAEKYLRMILRETRFASPEATIRSTTAVLGDSQAGTIGGEFLRSAMQFKSFPIAILMLHGARVARELSEGRMWSGAQYAAMFLAVGTMYGAVSMSLKDIVAGKDTRRWKDEETFKTFEFWGAALLQSGGLGIWGDFLFADLNRFGGGPIQTLAGPLAGRIDQIRNLGPGNIKEAIGGDKSTNAGRELARFLKQNTPIIGSLWYTKRAYEALVVDTLQRMLDPDAEAAFRRRMQKERKDYQRDFFWRPGQMSPDRTPELNVLRQR